MFDQGRGVPKDATEAARWYRKAAEQGNTSAQFNMGLSYDNGTGVPKDVAEAIRWYRLAAEQGNRSAQNNLGLMYERGEGVVANPVIAYALFNLAAAQGNDKAPSNRARVAEQLSPKQLEEAQALSSGWQVNTPLPTKTLTWKPAATKPAAKPTAKAEPRAAAPAAQPVSTSDCRPKTASLTCQSSCTNGNCVVAYTNGCRMRVQVNPKFNPFNSQWEYPSPSC